MKSKFIICALVFCACGIVSARASDCIGDGCYIEPLNISDTTPVWDFTAPELMDTSASSSWQDRPLFRDINSFYVPSKLNNADYITRGEVEELLNPRMPNGNLWSNDVWMKLNGLMITELESAPDVTECEDSGYLMEDDGCPFETDWECDIWRKKPTVREIVVPRSKKLRGYSMGALVDLARSNPEFDISEPAAAPLLNRYQALMRTSNSCCTNGMVYQLKKAGASNDLVYKFLVDDANFYQVGERCLVTNDAKIGSEYPNYKSVTNVVRDNCLCLNRQWFSAMLAPFEDLYRAVPDFADAPLEYTYIDGLNREITVSINQDVQAVLDQLSNCP